MNCERGINMKKLNKFLKFDLVAFVKGKTFEIVEVKPHFCL